MPTVAAVDVVGERRTWTVLGQDHLPLPAVEEFLEYLRVSRWAANSVRSYAQALQQYFTFLELVGLLWVDIDAPRFGAFMTWLRTGLAPGATPLNLVADIRRPATVAARVAAVFSFYNYQHDANDVPAVGRLQRHAGARRSFVRGGYASSLTGVTRRRASGTSPMFRVTDWQRAQTPVLTPQQVAAIFAACGGSPEEPGSLSRLRDRLVLETLHETGMRLGECLALKHRDWVVGMGKTAFIEVVPRQDHPHGYTVKRARPRRVYVSDRLAAFYGEYVWRLCDVGAADAHDPLDDWWVFVNCTTHGELFKPMRAEGIRSTIASIKRRHGASVPAQWSPHWFRHTHATTLLLAGVPAHVVMRRLGHRDVQTTLTTYGWVTEDAELKLLADWQTVAAGWAVESELVRR